MLKGKTAIITGAGRGIGRAIALQFAQYGARVVLNYRNSISQVEELLQIIRNAGGEAIAIRKYLCVEINLSEKGTFFCMKHAAQVMLKQRFGKIINISSVVGIAGNMGQTNYAASKAGVIGMTKTAARELSSRGITVNAVAPGFIETDMTEPLPDKIKEASIAAIPLGRFGNANEVAAAVSFLASEAANYITGQVLQVDGGMIM